MSLEKVKRKLEKILIEVMNYELNKLQTEKEIRELTNNIKKLTEEIKSIQIT